MLYSNFCNHFYTGFLLNFFFCVAGNGAALLGDGFAFAEGLRFFFFVYFSSYSHGEHVQYELYITHIIAQIFFFDSFEVFIALHIVPDSGPGYFIS